MEKMTETNIEIKVEEKFPAGTNVVKETEGDNDDVSKEVHGVRIGMNMKKELMKLLEIKKYNRQTEIVVHDDIAFWTQTCSGQLLVDLVTLAHKMFQKQR